jgi:hypothetical protein
MNMSSTTKDTCYLCLRFPLCKIHQQHNVYELARCPPDQHIQIKPFVCFSCVFIDQGGRAAVGCPSDETPM